MKIHSSLVKFVLNNHHLHNSPSSSLSTGGKYPTNAPSPHKSIPTMGILDAPLTPFPVKHFWFLSNRSAPSATLVKGSPEGPPPAPGMDWCVCWWCWCCRAGAVLCAMTVADRPPPPSPPDAVVVARDMVLLLETMGKEQGRAPKCERWWEWNK
jgi:hypothetical protein